MEKIMCIAMSVILSIVSTTNGTLLTRTVDEIKPIKQVTSIEVSIPVEKEKEQYTFEPETFKVEEEETVVVYSEEVEPETPQIIVEEQTNMSEEDINLIALVTMAEAEGECEEGKRLVIDTILNRVDHKRFPNTVSEVIYQPHQFTSVWNGRIDRCYVMDDIKQLVKEELISRTNSNVVFFRTDRYSSYGVPMFQVENHYFSSYE